MNSPGSSKGRDLTLIILSFAIIFGCGFIASRILSKEKPVPEVPVVADTNWESSALQILKEKLKLTPEQEESALGTLQKTQADLNDIRERALLEYYLHLLKTHDQLAPILDAEQQALMLESRKELEASIRKKFPRYLPENQLVDP